MFVELPVNITPGGVLALKVGRMMDHLNYESNAMKVSPFLVAPNRGALLAGLKAFEGDIDLGATSLKMLTGDGTVEFDREASRADAVAERFLALPCEVTVRKAFDQVRAAVSSDLFDMRDHARKTAEIDPDLAKKTMMHVNAMKNVVVGIGQFYTQVPAEATADFIFK